MAKGGMPEGVKTVLMWAIGLGILALTLIILLILFGNLSGNTGFTSGSQGYNDTENVILNYSASAVNTAVQFPTVGTILGIAILLIVLIGILVFAISRMMAAAGGAGSSNASFG